MTCTKTPNSHEAYHLLIGDAYSALANPVVGPRKDGLLNQLLAVCNLPVGKPRYVAILSNAFSAGIGNNRQDFKIVAVIAEDAAAVKAAYDTHAAAIKGLVDAALAA